MIRFDRAQPGHRVGVTSLLRSINPCRLVPPRAIPAGSPARLFEVEITDRLWKAPAVAGHTSARCVAVRKLVARLVSLPEKRSVAVLIRSGDRILATRRSDNDDELPGIWGLPAGSFRNAETLDDL